MGDNFRKILSLCYHSFVAQARHCRLSNQIFVWNRLVSDILTDMQKKGFCVQSIGSLLENYAAERFHILHMTSISAEFNENGPRLCLGTIWTHSTNLTSTSTDSPESKSGVEISLFGPGGASDIYLIFFTDVDYPVHT